MSIDREVLIAEATACGEALGCLRSTEYLTRLLSRPDSKVIKFAYQPTFMPHLNVLSCLVDAAVEATRLTQSGTPVVPIMFVVDFDTGAEKRFRRCDLPVSDLETMYLTSGLSKTQGAPARYALPRTSAKSQYELRRDVELYYLRIRSLFGRGMASDFLDVLSVIWPDTQESLSITCLRSLAFMTEHVLFTPVLFVRLSELRATQRSTMIELAQAIAERQHGDLPLWSICTKCHIRCPVTATSCSHCGTDLHVLDDGIPAEVFPKVVLDNILDYDAPYIIGGHSYFSGIDHLDQSARMASQLGLTFGPEVVSRVHVTKGLLPKWYSCANPLISSGRAGLPFWMWLFGRDGMIGLVEDLSKWQTCISSEGKNGGPLFGC